MPPAHGVPEKKTLGLGILRPDFFAPVDKFEAQCQEVDTTGGIRLPKWVTLAELKARANGGFLPARSGQDESAKVPRSNQSPNSHQRPCSTPYWPGGTDVGKENISTV
jgi:hypothetical protein